MQRALFYCNEKQSNVLDLPFNFNCFLEGGVCMKRLLAAKIYNLSKKFYEAPRTTGEELVLVVYLNIIMWRMHPNVHSNTIYNSQVLEAT